MKHSEMWGMCGGEEFVGSAHVQDSQLRASDKTTNWCSKHTALKRYETGTNRDTAVWWLKPCTFGEPKSEKWSNRSWKVWMFGRDDSRFDWLQGDVAETNWWVDGGSTVNCWSYVLNIWGLIEPWFLLRLNCLRDEHCINLRLSKKAVTQLNWSGYVYLILQSCAYLRRAKCTWKCSIPTSTLDFSAKQPGSWMWTRMCLPSSWTAYAKRYTYEMWMKTAS